MRQRDSKPNQSAILTGSATSTTGAAGDGGLSPDPSMAVGIVIPGEW